MIIVGAAPAGFKNSDIHETGAGRLCLSMRHDTFPVAADDPGNGSFLTGKDTSETDEELATDLQGAGKIHFDRLNTGS